jgi:hypothetical protein
MKNIFDCIFFDPIQASLNLCTSCEPGEGNNPSHLESPIQPELSSGSDNCWPRLHSGVGWNVRPEHNFVLASNLGRE